MITLTLQMPKEWLQSQTTVSSGQGIYCIIQPKTTHLVLSCNVTHKKKKGKKKEQQKRWIVNTLITHEENYRAVLFPFWFHSSLLPTVYFPPRPLSDASVRWAERKGETQRKWLPSASTSWFVHKHAIMISWQSIIYKPLQGRKLCQGAISENILNSLQRLIPPL